MVDYTKRRNKNRGYMKLDVWHKSIDLYKLVYRIVYIENKIEFKIRAQIADAAQSVAGNIAEGYCRRSILENIMRNNHHYSKTPSLHYSIQCFCILKDHRIQN